MAIYRMTIRFGTPKQQYHVIDISADSLRAALRTGAEQFPKEGAGSADLLEIRLQKDPDARVFGPA